MKKQFSTLWRFLLPVFLLLVIAPFLLTSQQTAQHVKNIELEAKGQALTFVRLLTVTDELMSEQASSALAILKERSLNLGAPNIEGEVSLGGEVLPNLRMGGTSVAGNFPLVDKVSWISGGTATLFVRSNNDFIRVTTNVQKKDGSRAVGTRLDPNGRAIVELLKGKAFFGVVDILGEPYITRYDAIFDVDGKVIGAYYVGYKVDINILRQTVEDFRYLKSGFAVILDDHHRVRFLSSHANPNSVSQLLKSQPSDWVFVKEPAPQWGFNVTIAYPLSEARASGLANAWVVVVAEMLLGILLLVLILWQLRHLVFNPIGGDPAVAIDIVQKIASGDLTEDHQQAKPNTLMAHVLEMRTKLRDTVATLRSNAERMALSANVFDHAHDGIFITDAARRIVEVNPSFTQITGYSREESLGKLPAELGFVVYDDEVSRQLWDTSEHDGEWRGETWNKRKSDDVYPAWLDIFAVRNDESQITHYVGLFSDITESKDQQKKLERMAYHDPLTNLPNRALLADRLRQGIARTERTGEMMAVCCLDLDGFKPVNDTLGHEAGDYLLAQLAVRMSICLRETDTVARLGGDEFAVLLCGLQSIEECQQTLERLLYTIKMPYEIGDRTVTISSSIGYTIFPHDQNEPDTLLRHADHAMYQSKMNGGSSIRRFDSDYDKEFRGLRKERERIHQALLDEEFRLFYQPKVDLRHGTVVGMEALIRWQHPEQGLRSPIAFLPAVEETDFMIPLGEWIIRDALRQMQLWQSAGLSFQVSVNIAARHMVQENFADRLELLLAEFPAVNHKKLEFEITETAAIEDVTTVAKTINRCKAMGISFALDDFGVGYSSLTYLRRLPVEVIKIDQSFVRDMLQDIEDLSVVAGVISLSRDFKRKVVAEGVETAEQGAWLLRMGCPVIQGYGIARPMPADEVQNWAQSFSLEGAWVKA